MKAFAAALLLCGCDRVFGVDPPGFDEPLVRHEGRFERVHVADTPNGIEVQPAPYAASEFAVRLFQRGVELPIDWDPDSSTYSFDAIADEPFRILVQGPDGPRYEVQSTSLYQRHRAVLYDRLSSPLPTMPTSIRGTITNPQAGTHRLITTSTWTQEYFTPFDVAGTTGTYDVPWGVGRPLVQTSRGDRMFVIAEGDRGSYRAIERHAAVMLDMQSGVNMLNVTLEPETLPLQCTTIQAPFEDLEARVAAAYPDFTSVPGHWGIYGTPASEVGPSVLAFLAEADEPTPNVEVQYVDPYGMSRVATARAQRQTSMLTSGGGEIAVYAFLYRFVAVDSSDCPTSPTTQIPDGNLDVPARFELGGQPIDGASTIDIRGTTEVELAWEAAGAEVFYVNLYDVTMSKGYGEPVRSFRLDEPRAVLESALLIAGRRYVLVAQAIRGLPDYANGNLADFAFPLELAVGTSPVFEVTR